MFPKLRRSQVTHILSLSTNMELCQQPHNDTPSPYMNKCFEIPCEIDEDLYVILLRGGVMFKKKSNYLVESYIHHIDTLEARVCFMWTLEYYIGVAYNLFNIVGIKGCTQEVHHCGTTKRVWDRVANKICLEKNLCFVATQIQGIILVLSLIVIVSMMTLLSLLY